MNQTQVHRDQIARWEQRHLGMLRRLPKIRENLSYSTQRREDEWFVYNAIVEDIKRVAKLIESIKYVEITTFPLAKDMIARELDRIEQETIILEEKVTPKK